jgi:hypothetical protein
MQIIVGQHISKNANDKQELEPALKVLQDTDGRLPDQLSAYNGYFFGDNLPALEHSGIDAFIATDKGEKSHKTALDGSERSVVKADFTYNEADNTFRCPEGQVLEMSRESQDAKRVHQGSYGLLTMISPTGKSVSTCATDSRHPDCR